MSPLRSQDNGDAFRPCSTDHVGSLFVYSEGIETGKEWKIFANEELLIGRDANSCQLVVDDPTVSNTHVRIYTIIFDQENPTQVAPLVYAQDLSLNGAFWNGYKIGKGNGGFLLSDGDIIKISCSVTLKYNCENLSTSFNEVQSQEMDHLRGHYEVTSRVVGCGAYGRVHMAIDKQKKKQMACKIVNLADLETRLRHLDVANLPKTEGIAQDSLKRRCLTDKVQTKLRVYDREVEILQKLRHPNIIGIEKVFKTHDTLYIFQDLITAGDLFSFLEHKKGRLLDVEAAVIVRQVVLAIAYLHSQNVVHRDLKPDNVLMTSLSNGARVILTDFGCARYQNPKSSRMASIMGTLEYTAPEMGQRCSKPAKGYTKSVDLWSLGCLTVVLLTGGSPFSDPVTGKYSEDLAKQCNLKVLEGDEDWQNVGQRAKEFVRGLLVLNDERRMTAEEALRHDWFTNSAHGQAFDELYMRAIRGWQPREENEVVLYDLRYERGSMGDYCFWQGRAALKLLLEDLERRAEDSPKVEELSFSSGHQRKGSITLSDTGNQDSPAILCDGMDVSPHFPRASVAPNQEVAAQAKLTGHVDAAKHHAESRIRKPFSPEAWNKKNDSQPIQQLEGAQVMEKSSEMELEQIIPIAKTEGSFGASDLILPSSLLGHPRMEVQHSPGERGLDREVIVYREDEVYEQDLDL